MTPSSSSPQLSKWIFLATDVVLLAAAWLIADQAGRPLSNAAIFAVVACVIAGAVVAIVPMLAYYEREKNQALDERQRALEALAQTIANSAEQISAAAGGLHQIAELTQKNLRHAEQLPHKLQDKIAEFQAQLANAGDTEKEELEQELNALRTSESERLQSISDKIARSTAELAKLEATAQKSAAAAHEGFLKAQAQAAASLDEKLRGTVATLDTKLHSLATAMRLAAAPPPAAGEASNAIPFPSSPPVTNSVPVDPEPSAGTPPIPESAAKTDGASHPPKRPRKPRRDEPAADTFIAGETSPGHTAGLPAEEPPPAKLLEITPVAPDSKAPYATENGAPTATAVTTSPLPRAEVTAGTASPKVARKRLEKKSAGNGDDGVLNFELPPEPAPTGAAAATGAPVSEFTQVSPEEAAPVAAVAADGATRLIVTAYIGIGNRLFIRGEGPGLSWEKGVPLQFVSIGKWRWETADATAPVKFKLYKNDDVECAALGARDLAAGHQQELAATF
ncbi:MAG TPA: hypothetical protein VHO24_17170 [Opitutaceae bacterium]|nr:hypothetical protein [Opitutaceae bacterium]